jgi:hypothetical protein
MAQLTIRDLKRMCDEQIRKGNADKMIVISDDNEGNGFHGLFYGFTIIKKKEKEWFTISDSNSDDVEKIIILG